MQQILDVAEVEMHVWPSADLVFEAQWWIDAKETEGVDLSGIAGQIRRSGTLLLDFEPHTTITDNKASVRVPSATLAAIDWPEDGDAEWDFILIADATGERRPFARGPVQIHARITQ